MHKLVKYIDDELMELERKADKGKLSMQEIEYMDTLAHAKKNILKSDEMDGGEYSYRMNSYARGRRRDAMGRYSGEYSRAKEDFRMELEELMRDAPSDHVRQKLQNIMSEM